MFELVQAWKHESEGLGLGRAFVPAEHPFLSDHFPGAPLLPATLAVELMAQIAGPLIEERLACRDERERWAFLALIRHAKFHKPIPLPARLELSAELIRLESQQALVRTKFSSEKDPGGSAELLFTLAAAEAGWEEALATRRSRLAKWKAAW